MPTNKRRRARGGGHKRRAPSFANVSADAAKIAIVMMDNRPPDFSLWLKQHGASSELTLDSQAQLVTMLTAYLNMRYACRHGYTLLFYKLRRPGCAHPLWGARHPSYCKLTAIGEALAAGYEWVVYLDSDAFVRASGSLPALLHKYGAPADAASAGASTRLPEGSPEAFFGWDHPFTLGPNMGFIALRNTPSVRAMVRLWWNSYAATFSLEHPFEQRTLQWQVMHLQRYARRVQTLSLRTMDDSYPDDVVHLDHNAGTKTRIWVMAGAAAQLVVALDGAGGAAHARLLRHMHTLSMPREGLGKKHRRPVIEAVVRAARRDLDSPAFARECLRHVEDFNATSSALRHLWHGSMGVDAGTDDANGQSVVVAAAATSVETAGDSGDGDEEALTGMPLHLTNCSDSPLHAPWQTWRLTTEQRTPKGTVCQGLCLAHRFSLQARPALCLSLGTTRTPRNPFQTHAQLAACKTSIRGETPEAMRARLHFNAKSRTIKTTHRVADFRRGLPEHRTTCGFWPACSSMRLLLPKPCWARLATNLTACGEEEESVANILQRDRGLPPSERAVDANSGFVVGASGPVPARMLNTSGRDRLCLTAWRGKNLENAAAVFLRCPQGSGRHSKWRSSRNFEWRAIRVDGGGEGEGHGELVRVSPRATPTLCLAAPPIASPGLVAALGAVVGRAVR